ncbi:MAG: SDR family oxidoreductase [Candidatus Micrarchaeota archaeon]|nr:SDR family oxidoreductase [Candidatus Micrarchaeota archaeon]
MDLKNKVVLVTGSSSGIGAATAKAFAAKGAKTIIHYNYHESAARKIQAATKSELCLHADLSVVDECRDLIQKTAEHFGRIDVLVNNAGVSTPANSHLTLEERWEKMNAVNLRAPFLLSAYAREHMKKGCIVNVSSIRAYRPKNALSAYGTTKAGVSYMTKALAHDFAPDVRVNAVAPGYARTEMTEKFYGDKFSELERQTPIGRIIKPEEIADSILFLCQNDAITGHVLVIDGGYLVG